MLIGIPRHDSEKRNGRTQHRRSIRKYNKSWKNAVQQGSPAMKSISLIRMIVLPNSFNALRSAAFPPLPHGNVLKLLQHISSMSMVDGDVNDA